MILETHVGAEAPNFTVTQTQFISPQDLGRRWKCSAQTLAIRRKTRTGPRFCKIGGRIRYRLADIEAFEREAEEA